MNAPIKDGGPAFPVGSDDMRDPVGMTLRDYFASRIMQSLLSSSTTMANINRLSLEDGKSPSIFAATAAYEFADAMLRAREVTA